MTDVHNAEIRSKNMTAIKSRNTKPELIIRTALYKAGDRYRLHVKQLSGKPDIVLAKYKAVLFINGCFWHGHNCHLFKWPQTRKKFWQEKINNNIENDRKKIKGLSSEWRTGIIWECALKGKTRISLNKVINKIKIWLGSDEFTLEIRG